ncbi:MAG: DUF748 domain-containing protein, partial [Candidatus Tectimicrobiota bacterium]
MRRALLIAAIAVGVILTILVVLPTFIDVNRYRAQIATTLEKTLHRKVTLGEIRLGLLGGPRLRVADVAIADEAKFGEGPAVTAEGLDVRLQLLPLLSRRIAFSKLALRRPTIRLTILEDGRTNFSDLLGAAPPGRLKAPPSPGTAPPAPRAPTPPAGLTVSRLDILGGTLSVIDHHTVPGTPLTHRLEDLDIRLRDVSRDSPIEFDVAGTLVRETRQPFRLKGVVGPVGASPQPAQLPITMSVQTQGLELAPLQPYVRDLYPITILAGSVTSDITLTRKIPDRLATQGSIRFEAVEFADPTTGYRPPGPLTLEVDQSIEANLKAGTIKAERFRITIGNSTIVGSGTVAKVRTVPELDLQVRSDGVALEDLAQLDPSLPDRLPPGLTLSGPLALEIAYQGTLSDFTARGSVDAKRSQLAWKGLVAKAAGVPAKLRFDSSYDGRSLTLRETHLDLATLTLDASGSITDLAHPTVDLNLATNTVGLAGWERVLPVLKKNPLHGQVSFTGKVAGSTRDPAKSRLAGRLVLSKVGPVETILTLVPALKASWPRDLALAGTATAEVAFDGTLESFDITGKADLKDGDFRYGELLTKPRGERANLTLKGRYRGGDVTIEQIALAIKDLEATGRASAKNLEDPVIDLALRTNQVDLAQWSPAGKRLTGKVGLVVGVKGQLFTPEALAFTQAKLTASGIGPLETVLEALPSVRESLPKGFKMKGRADVSVSLSGSYPNLSGRAVVDLTQASLHHPDWVVKPAGRPARLAVEGRNSDKALTVKAFEAILGKDWVRGSAHVADFDQPRGSLTVASSPMKLEQLAEALPVLKRYGLAGSVTVDINVQGDTARLKQAQAKGIVEVKELKARLPQLAAPLEKMTGTLELKGQEATLKRFVVAYGDSLVSLSATARGFDAPQVAFALDAPRLVLDQWKAPKKKRPLRRPKASREPAGPASLAQIVLVKAPARPSGL